MQQTEYQQLIQSSAAFKELPKALQNSVLEATGKRMERFAKIFLKAHKALEKAKQDFVKENDRIMSKLKRTVQKVKKEKRVDDEKRSDKADMAKATSLLHNLKTL